MAIAALLPMAWIPFWVSPLHFVAAAIVFVMLVRCYTADEQTVIIHHNLFCRQAVLNISWSVARPGLGTRLRRKPQMLLFSYGSSAPLRQLLPPPPLLLLTRFRHRIPH